MADWKPAPPDTASAKEWQDSAEGVRQSIIGREGRKLDKSKNMWDQQTMSQRRGEYQRRYKIGMQKERLAKGVTKMVGGKEVNR